MLQNIETIEIKLNFYSEHLAYAVISTKELHGDESFQVSLTLTNKDGTQITLDNVTATIEGEKTNFDPLKDNTQFTVKLKC